MSILPHITDPEDLARELSPAPSNQNAVVLSNEVSVVPFIDALRAVKRCHRIGEGGLQSRKNRNAIGLKVPSADRFDLPTAPADPESFHLVTEESTVEAVSFSGDRAVRLARWRN